MDETGNIETVDVDTWHVFPIRKAPEGPVPQPDCFAPSGLAKQWISGDSASVCWNTSYDHTMQVSYGPAGTAPDLNTIVTVAPNVGVCRLRHLDTGDCNVYIRKICHYVCPYPEDAEEDFFYGDWSEPITLRIAPPPDTTSAIATAEHLPTLSLAPNPATGSVTVTTSEPILLLEAYDTQGRKQHSCTPKTTTLTLDTHAWPRGSYILSATTPKGQTSTTLILQ